MKNIIKQYVLNDIRLKALSLVLAAMLWFAISYIGESKMTVSVPINVENLRKELMIRNMETDAALVTISGPISILKNMRAREIRLAVSLAGAQEGARAFAIRKDDVIVPKGIKVEEVKPDYLTVEIDKAVEKRLKVIVKLDEKWAKTYGIESWYPRYATMEGAEWTLRNRDSIETIPVDGQFRDKAEEIDVPLAVKGMLLRKIKPDTVRVRLRRN
jgi:YbbR domain-containing protein